jgi:hypothetical protein
LVETAVTLMEKIMAEVTHLNWVGQHITAAIKNVIEFEWWMVNAHFTTNE